MCVCCGWSAVFFHMLNDKDKHLPETTPSKSEILNKNRMYIVNFQIDGQLFDLPIWFVTPSLSFYPNQVYNCRIKWGRGVGKAKFFNFNTHIWIDTYHERCTKCGILLYKYGKAIRYSVRTGWRIITLLMSLNSFQSSSLQRSKEEKKTHTKIINESQVWIEK